jgi:hypothetical protein
VVGSQDRDCSCPSRLARAKIGCLAGDHRQPGELRLRELEYAQVRAPSLKRILLRGLGSSLFLWCHDPTMLCIVHAPQMLERQCQMKTRYWLRLSASLLQPCHSQSVQHRTNGKCPFHAFTLLPASYTLWRGAFCVTGEQPRTDSIPKMAIGQCILVVAIGARHTSANGTDISSVTPHRIESKEA